MAWKLLTEVYGLPKERIYITYFGGDENLGLGPDLEAKQLWLDLGIDPIHVIPFGSKDNFWGLLIINFYNELFSIYLTTI